MYHFNFDVLISPRLYLAPTIVMYRSSCSEFQIGITMHVIVFINRNIKRLVYCQYGQYSLTFRALTLRQRETGFTFVSLLCLYAAHYVYFTYCFYGWYFLTPITTRFYICLSPFFSIHFILRFANIYLKSKQKKVGVSSVGPMHTATSLLFKLSSVFENQLRKCVGQRHRNSGPFHMQFGDFRSKSRLYFSTLNQC